MFLANKLYLFDDVDLYRLVLFLTHQTLYLQIECSKIKYLICFLLVIIVSQKFLHQHILIRLLYKYNGMFGSSGN